MASSTTSVPTSYATDLDVGAAAETLAGVVSNLPGIGLWRVRSDGAVWWSPAQYALFGLDPAKGVPPPADLFRMYHADDGNIVAKALRDCFKSSEPALLRYRVIRPDGEVRHVHSSHVRLPDDGQGRVVVVGMDTDVTDRDDELQRVRESERLFRFVADNTRDLIVRYKPDSELIYLSRACKAVMGYDPEELVGVRTLDLMHPDDLERAGVDTGALFASGTNMSDTPGEYRFRHKSGRWIWLECHPRLVRNGAGEIVEQVDVVRDITVRRRAEDEAAVARAQAHVSALAKSEFLANMSHELRTPLTSVVGFSRLIGQGGGLSGVDGKYVELVRTASETLLAVVNDILDFSKLEAGAVELSHETFRVSDLVTGVAALMEDQAREKGLSLSLVVERDARLLGDPARLRQILLNLVGNAVKFTERGEVTIKAELTSSEAGARLRLVVRDTGIGIPLEQQAAVFERFSQGDTSSSRRFGGTGLGLSISRRLVELMGGSIGVDSDGESGSSFWVELGLTLAETPLPAELATERRHSSPQPARILLAEDNPANRTLIAALLAPFDVQLDIVENGAAAVGAATATRYDLILMDMQMPVMDGLTACRHIRALGGGSASTPIVALTANVLPEQVAQCLEAGMSDHVAKPIVPQSLFDAIERHVQPADLDQAA